MKQRHLILNQNSHGVYTCLCGAKWRLGERPDYRCPLAHECIESESMLPPGPGVCPECGHLW